MPYQNPLLILKNNVALGKQLWRNCDCILSLPSPSLSLEFLEHIDRLLFKHMLFVTYSWLSFLIVTMNDYKD